MSKRCGIIVCLFMIICIPTAVSASGFSAVIEPLEWTWVPGEAASFSGTVIVGDEWPGGSVLLRLSADNMPSDNAEEYVIFSSVNGKQLKIRNQKSEYQMDVQPETKIHFSGSWLLPTNQRFEEITVHLAVYDADGNQLCESSLEMTQAHHMPGTRKGNIPDVDILIRYILIAAAAVWVLAAVRIIFHRRKVRNHADL